MVRRLADTVRCAWALLYWNARKSCYVLGGRRSRCPCQNPSDIGSSRQGVRCDASLHLHEPLRFRRVCPLVVPGPGGRGAYCSVPASQVRPFWGRALGFYGGAALACWLAATTAVFVGLRATGLRDLAWTHVAWPGSWGEIRQARSRYFLGEALAACARRDFSQAYRSMITAVVLDPRNYDARLLTAQYAAFAGSELASDELFARLGTEFPELRLRTAITRHDTLLGQGRFETLAEHCLKQADARGPQSSIWTGSLVLAMHLGRLGPAWVDAQQPGLSGLPPESAGLVHATAALASGDEAGALAALRRPYAAGIEGNLVVEQIRLLLAMGAGVDAEMAWTINGERLPEFDRLLTRCWVDAAQGYRALATLQLAALADRASSPEEWDKLLATVIMQPDREAFKALHARLVNRAELATPQLISQMWVGALVVDAGAERETWTALARQKFNARYPEIQAIDFKSVRGDTPGTVPFLTGALPLGREVIAALYWRVDPPSVPAAKSRRK